MSREVELFSVGRLQGSAALPFDRAKNRLFGVRVLKMA